MNKTRFGNIAIGAPGSKARIESNKEFLKGKTCEDNPFYMDCELVLAEDRENYYCKHCGTIHKGYDGDDPKCDQEWVYKVRENWAKPKDR